MSDALFRTQSSSSIYPTGLGVNWGAIWGGVFGFAAIWAVFEMLAVAIFPSTVSAGFQVWTVILTLIAMYVAGFETGRLANLSSTHDGLVHGMMMFGLSVISVIVLTSFANGIFGAASVAHNNYVLAVTPGTEWFDFAALFLGWLGAMGGASTGVTRRYVEIRRTTEPPIQMRPAA